MSRNGCIIGTLLSGKAGLEAPITTSEASPSHLSPYARLRNCKVRYSPLDASMTESMPLAVPTRPSVPTVIVGNYRVPRTTTFNLKALEALDENLSFDAEQQYAQSHRSPDSDDQGTTFHRDREFVTASKSECNPKNVDENEKLPSSFPSKIVLEARKKARNAVRLGSYKDGFDALESGLQALRGESVGSSDSWRLGEVEILLDLGRKTEARETLAHCDIPQQSHQGNIPVRRPILRKSSSASDAQFEEEMAKFNNDIEQPNQEEILKAWLRAEDWVKAKEAAEKLHRIDPSYFDIQKKMDRFRKCRQMLEMGVLAEKCGPGADTDKTRKSLAKALRLYNQGCFATELFHKHFDPPQAQVNGFDHNDCTNLFFSAARVCVLFHDKGVFDEHGTPLNPKEFTLRFKNDKLPCSPPLTERDWQHQALHFMEQGRSRALLETILRGDPEEPVTARQRRYHMVDVALAARETIRIKKRTESFLAAAESRSVTLPTPLGEKYSLEEYMLLGINNNTSPSLPPTDIESEIPQLKKSRSLALGPLLDTADLDDYKNIQALPSPPSSYSESDPGGTNREKALAKSQAQIRWQKALLYALVNCNPTLITSKLPADTAVIEYALVTAPPEGLISMVITSNGIKACLWQELDTVHLQLKVANLLSSMHSSNERTRHSVLRSLRTAEPMNTEELRKELSKVLLKPIEKSLKGKKKLIIIPSGELAHVPWTLLIQLPVAIVPSLSFWDHLNKTSPKSSASQRVSVVGNPPRNEDGTLRDKDIPFSHMEAFYIARINKDLPFLTHENNRKQFQERVALTRILHLSAHGTFDDQDPVRSGIQLFGEPLTIHDWRNLAIKADLVVFSSCLSGISKAFHSGSAFGFAHTLLGTGTRAFIGSLWPVIDLATFLLMMMFHDALREFSPAEALKKEAKDQSIEKYVDRPWFWIRKLDDMSKNDIRNLREPRCWAAFVLTGINEALALYASDGTPPLSNIVGLPGFEWVAKNHINTTAYTYYRNGAAGEWPYHNNLGAFQRIRLRPHAMVDITNIESTLSPCAQADYGNSGAELGLVQGTNAGNILYIPSLFAYLSVEEIAAGKPSNAPQVLFQHVYLDSNDTTALQILQ
ncbi:hypothetical protein G7Y89_g9327 [Cudoniella acicularis]|uniref:CHAT domain-containing protein n=1 Tax=Cudoniella acicularis TaxID=354080 RepID=A0A8H4W074_9HELO|nr:hypothetical protein G7Y89_g9327 [Cudoniella acicularis]